VDHPNKNEILALFYYEATERDTKKLTSHIQQCESCREYIENLNRIGNALSELPDEQPSSQIFENIIAEISVEKLRPARQPQFFLLKPILKIAVSLIMILSIIYLIQCKISLLPIWQSLSQYWLVQAIGSFGVVLILFFCIGTFVALSLAPILIMEKTKIS
jgi:hypothetical protein